MSEASVTMEEYVSGLIKRARAAQATIENYSQEEVDRLCRIIARTVTVPDEVQKIGRMSYEESGYGNLESKILKLDKVKGTLWDIRNVKSVGVIEEIPERGLVKLAKPVGVIAALVPSTQPEVTPPIKAMFALKGRNAVVFSPHPKTQKTSYYVIELMRQALKKHGYPEDLLICAENPTISMSNEIMKQADLIVATGGSPMVRAAYSSGTPAFGAGVGNANVVIDETANIEDTVKILIKSKDFDFSSGCSSENSAIVNEQVYDSFMHAMLENGAYLLNTEEKAKLQKALWPDWPQSHALGRDIIMHSVSEIAQKAGINVPEGIKVLLVEETGCGEEYPFSGEKLCVVLTVYKYGEFKEAIDIIKKNQEYQGLGHSCGIHSYDDERIMELAEAMKTTRVAVRQAMAASNSGGWGSGNAWTTTLGCGTWGGNSASENLTVKHFLNTTWISRPITPFVPTDEELFGSEL